MQCRVMFFTLVALAAPAYADDCPQPIYQGMESGAILRFLGETGPSIPSEHGEIETRSPRHVFTFTTSYSNGPSREYLSLDGFPAEDTVESVVMRKNPDFTNAAGPAAFILTPDLVVKYYYATNQDGQEAMHAIQLDETWKRIGCGGPVTPTVK